MISIGLRCVKSNTSIGVCRVMAGGNVRHVRGWGRGEGQAAPLADTAQFVRWVTLGKSLTLCPPGRGDGDRRGGGNPLQVCFAGCITTPDTSPPGATPEGDSLAPAIGRTRQQGRYCHLWCYESRGSEVLEVGKQEAGCPRTDAGRRMGAGIGCRSSCWPC